MPHTDSIAQASRSTRPRQLFLFEGCISKSRNHQPPVTDFSKERIRSLEKQLQVLTRQLDAMKTMRAEFNAIKPRYKKLLKVKLKAEESRDVYLHKLSAAARVAAARILETEMYANHCLKLYESACDIIQSHIVKHHSKERWLTHTCPGCGSQPIHRFGVRTLPSGNLGFAPYCIDCNQKRKNSAAEALKMTPAETAAAVVERVPKVSQKLVDHFEEEMEAEAAATPLS